MFGKIALKKRVRQFKTKRNYHPPSYLWEQTQEVKCFEVVNNILNEVSIRFDACSLKFVETTEPKEFECHFSKFQIRKKIKNMCRDTQKPVHELDPS